MSNKEQNDNNNILIRTDALNEIANALKGDKKVINVFGEGGVGKTTALLTIVERHVKEGTETNVKNVVEELKIDDTYYMEVSACVSDYEMYHNIVNEIEKKTSIKFKKFHILYNWYLEERKRGFQKGKISLKKDVFELLSQIIGIDLKNFYMDRDMQKQQEETNKIVAILENADAIRTLLEGGVGLVNVALNIYKIMQKTQEAKILKEVIELAEECNSDLDYRKILRKCLIDEWKEKQEQEKVTLFIMDNYRIQYSVEMNSNSAWLTELTNEIGQYWIIGSRTEIKGPQENCIAKVNMSGFNRKNAEDYIEGRILWDDYSKNLQVKIEHGESQSSKEELTNKILSVCINNEKYLPYQLNLIANFVNEKILKKESITIEDIVEYKKEEFVDYYYFSHMSEMVVAAVQLLSCIPAWNSETYNMLKKKFNYHYLEAEYLMHQCAFVEYKDGVIKLHEAIRDAVFASENNYIVRDVSKYLYRELTDKMIDKQAGNLIIDYFNIAETYIKNLENDEKLYDAEKKNFEKILDELYKFYKKKENTTLEFTEAYRGILKFVYGENSKECIKRELDCADLYTNLYMPETACKIEEDCLERLNKYFAKESLLRVQAYNWASFDNSKKWDYQKAYELGKDGLGYAHSVVEEVINGIDVSKEREMVEALKRILRVYNDEIDLVDQNDILYSMHKTEKEKLSVEKFVEDFLLVKGKWKERKEKEKKEEEAKGGKKDKEEEKEANKEDKLGEIINLLENQYNKIRGNFPWYYIKGAELSDKKTEIDVVAYGINTYYIRKCIFSINKKLGVGKNYEDLMLRSLENIAKYMFKLKSGRITKQIDDAILILEEAIQKRSYNVSVANENIIRTKRKLEILKGTVENVSISESNETSRRDIINKMCEHCKNLYNRFNFSENIWNLYYKDVVEQYSYLGDLYLTKRWYYEGLEKLSFALLQNYVEQQIFTAENMDAYCRASIALCGLKETELAKEFMDVVCRISNDNGIQCPESKRDEYKRVRNKIEKLDLVPVEEFNFSMVDAIYVELK